MNNSYNNAWNAIYHNDAKPLLRLEKESNTWASSYQTKKLLWFW